MVLSLMRDKITAGRKPEMNARQLAARVAGIRPSDSRRARIVLAAAAVLRAAVAGLSASLVADLESGAWLPVAILAVFLPGLALSWNMLAREVAAAPARRQARRARAA